MAAVFEADAEYGKKAIAYQVALHEAKIGGALTDDPNVLRELLANLITTSLAVAVPVLSVVAEEANRAKKAAEGN